MSQTKPKFEVREYKDQKSPAPASPSASIILVSPNNTILLLHRKQTSSAFPSAHVFPGGNLDPTDGALPANPTDPARHTDSLPYRVGAIRELFEETGILLAKASPTATSLLPLPAAARQSGRKRVHSGQLSFQQWLHAQHPAATLHTEGLIPFTHWVTPPNVPKRFSTQMYLYFVHLKETGNPSVQPSSDEVETMSPEYRRARDWLRAAQASDVILFPPQFLLLHLVSAFLDVETPLGSPKSPYSAPDDVDAAEIVSRRRKLYEFVTTDGEAGGPAWRDKYISPIGLPGTMKDGRSVLSLEGVGPELRGSGLAGDKTRVVLVRFQKEGPRKLEIRFRKEVEEEERGRQGGVKL